jgi:hypothetical protein
MQTPPTIRGGCLKTCLKKVGNLAAAHHVPRPGHHGRQLRARRHRPHANDSHVHAEKAVGAAAVAEKREVEGGDANGVEDAEEGVEAFGAEVGVGDLGLHAHAEDDIDMLRGG